MGPRLRLTGRRASPRSRLRARCGAARPLSAGRPMLRPHALIAIAHLVARGSPCLRPPRPFGAPVASGTPTRRRMCHRRWSSLSLMKFDAGRSQTNEGTSQTCGGRSQTNGGRSQTNGGRSRTNEGRSRTNEGRSRTNEGRSRTNEGRSRTNEGTSQSSVTHGVPGEFGAQRCPRFNRALSLTEFA